MTEPTSMLPGFTINRTYKFVVYISAVVLVFSLFFDAKGINNQWLRHVSFWTMIAGLGIWFTGNFLSVIYGKDDENALLGFLIFQGIVWAIIFFFLFFLKR
jgi:hypothetical protein